MTFRFFPATLLLFLSVPFGSAAVYHIDATAGDDAASGLLPDQAWRSLEKANATVLKPGDRLLFKAGARWAGQLKPQGTGDPTSLIQIGRYGDGPLPRIDGEGKHADTVLLKDIPFVEIADLEITNRGEQIRAVAHRSENHRGWHRENAARLSAPPVCA